MRGLPEEAGAVVGKVCPRCDAEYRVEIVDAMVADRIGKPVFKARIVKAKDVQWD
jgi:hypothetical protein